MKKVFLLIVIVFTVRFVSLAQNSFATIAGRFDFLQEGDSVSVRVCNYGSDWENSSNSSSYQKIYAKIMDHSFSFKIPITSEHPLQFQIAFFDKNSISTKRNIYMAHSLYGYIENSDRILFSDGGVTNGIKVSGKGSEKIDILMRFKTLDKYFEKGILFGVAAYSKRFFESQDSTTKHAIDYLEKQRYLLSDEAYILLKAQALAFHYNKGAYLFMNNDTGRNHALEILKSYRCDLSLEYLSNANFDKEPLLQNSEYYAHSLLTKYTYDSCYVTHKDFSIKKCYDYIGKYYSGGLRERMVTDLLYTYKSEAEDLRGCINDALSYFKNQDFINELNKLQSTRTIGITAYDFKLPDQASKTHTLSDYKGKVVFIDFWFTGCGNCVRVAPYLEKIEKLYRNKPVVFLSINLDKDKKIWLTSIKKGLYTSKYVTNLYTEGLEFKHPISKFYSVDGGPTLIMIDKQGKLMANPVDPRLDNGKDIVNKINKELNKPGI